MNKTQKAFLKTLLKSTEQAQQAQQSIADSISIGVKNKAACVEYVQELQHYIDATNRMIMQATIAFGAGASTIAAEASIRSNEN
jgi:hypothetical protein